MTPWLRTHTPLTQGHSSVPSTHFKQFTTAYNSSSRGSDSSGDWKCLHSHAHVHTILNNKDQCMWGAVRPDVGSWPMEVLSLEGNLSLLEPVLREGIVTKPELISMPLLFSGFKYKTEAIFSHKDSQPLPLAMTSSQKGPSVSSVPLNLQNCDLNNMLFFSQGFTVVIKR